MLLHELFDIAFADESFVTSGDHQPLDIRPSTADAHATYNDNTLAIVSTWRGTSLTWAHSWLRYHIAIGFARIYIFFDDPSYDEEVIDALRGAAEHKSTLTIIKVDKQYRKRFWSLKPVGPSVDSEPEQWLLPAFGVHIHTEHTARQILNVARAGVMAKADNIAWLLHIDSDEIFWLQGLTPGIARSFFAQLTNRGITHATIFNDEVALKTPDYTSEKLPKDPFHQRLFFKRNVLTMNPYQLSLVGQWEADKGVKLFLGYMCGKGAINVQLWRRNFGDSVPILPQHVVSFAVDYRQPGNVTVINRDSSIVQPFISSKKIKIACFTNHARILHYINPEFDSMLKKFTARKRFNTDIFDVNLVAERVRNSYRDYEKFWIKSEKMPNWEFYNEMWTNVRQGLKENKSNKALQYYAKVALMPQDKDLKRYLDAGIIYKNEHVVELIREVSRSLKNKMKAEKETILFRLCKGVNDLKSKGKFRNDSKVYALYRCKDKAPHFHCDVEHCCQFLKSPQFTFTKRLLGYKRYQPFEWWKPGLRWPRQ
eukprot:gene17692-19460_t